MLRISIYHWLPIADNMLSDILDHAKNNQNFYIIAELRDNDDAFYGKAIFHLNEKTINLGNQEFEFRINKRGFCQSVINLNLPGNLILGNYSLGAFLEIVIPAFNSFIADTIYDLLPMSARNKLAVLKETIVSYQEFESNIFSSIIETSAKSFLEINNAVCILIDKDLQKSMQTGFVISNIGLSVKAISDQSELFFSSHVNSVSGSSQIMEVSIGDVFLYYSENFLEEEKNIFDGVIYKYCALLVFVRFTNHVIDILKRARDHIIPLRRQLTIALQTRTEEHFDLLTNTKKYLTYINIKLPVIEKIQNYLVIAHNSELFSAKTNFLRNVQNIIKYQSLTLLSSKSELLNPEKIITKINDNTERLIKLLPEDIQEAKVISDELSMVLQGSLLSESVLIADRSLDTSRSSLEITRNAKNRENALKVLTIILSGNFGFTLAEHIFKILPISFIKQPILIMFDPDGTGNIFALFLGIFFPVLSFLYIEKEIAKKSSSFRLVIPVNSEVHPSVISNLLKSKKLTKVERYGAHNLVGWIETFKVKTSYINSNLKYLKRIWRRIKNGLRLYKNYNTKENVLQFEMTVDYETHGYVHAIILDTEYTNIDIDLGKLVISVLDRYSKLGFFDGKQFKDQEQLYKSHVAEILNNMEIYIDEKLIGLNKIFTLPIDELKQSLGLSEDNIITRQDREELSDIIEHQEDYKKWFYSRENNDMVKLLGEDNFEKKKEVILVITSKLFKDSLNKTKTKLYE